MTRPRCLPSCWRRPPSSLSSFYSYTTSRSHSSIWVTSTGSGQYSQTCTRTCLLLFIFVCDSYCLKSQESEIFSQWRSFNINEAYRGNNKKAMFWLHVLYHVVCMWPKNKFINIAIIITCTCIMETHLPGKYQVGRKAAPSINSTCSKCARKQYYSRSTILDSTCMCWGKFCCKFQNLTFLEILVECS